MLDGLADDKIDHYLDEQPNIVPLFEIDVAEAIPPYVAHREDEFEKREDDRKEREGRYRNPNLQRYINKE